MNDKKYRDWISRQPSCISGRFSEYVNGEGRNVACHVRRVSKGAGTGIKPEFYCVPLTHEEHMLQHQHGESAVAEKEWFDAMAEHYLALYRKSAFKL